MDPHLALQAILQGGNLKVSPFPINSRYHGIDTAVTGNGEGTIVYVKRRFLPSPGSLILLQEHLVTQAERLDNITARYYTDPELFWRICDANNAMHPDELIKTAGRRLRITLPEGIPGGSHA